MKRLEYDKILFMIKCTTSPPPPLRNPLGRGAFGCTFPLSRTQLCSWVRDGLLCSRKLVLLRISQSAVGPYEQPFPNTSELHTRFRRYWTFCLVLIEIIRILTFRFTRMLW